VANITIYTKDADKLPDQIKTLVKSSPKINIVKIDYSNHSEIVITHTEEESKEFMEKLTKVLATIQGKIAFNAIAHFLKS